MKTFGGLFPGLLVLTIGVSPTWAGTPTAFAVALEEAEANEVTPEGKAFDKVMGTQFGKRHAATMARCTEGAPDSELATFNLAMKLDGAGQVIEVLVQPETRVSKCLQVAVAKDTYSKPPRPNYWARVEMTIKP